MSLRSYNLLLALSLIASGTQAWCMTAEAEQAATPTDTTQMAAPTNPSATNSLTKEELLAQLSAQPETEAIPLQQPEATAQPSATPSIDAAPYAQEQVAPGTEPLVVDTVPAEPIEPSTPQPAMQPTTMDEMAAQQPTPMDQPEIPQNQIDLPVAEVMPAQQPDAATQPSTQQYYDAAEQNNSFAPSIDAAPYSQEQVAPSAEPPVDIVSSTPIESSAPQPAMQPTTMDEMAAQQPTPMDQPEIPQNQDNQAALTTLIAEDDDKNNELEEDATPMNSSEEVLVVPPPAQPTPEEIIPQQPAAMDQQNIQQYYEEPAMDQVSQVQE